MRFAHSLSTLIEQTASSIRFTHQLCSPASPGQLFVKSGSMLPVGICVDGNLTVDFAGEKVHAIFCW